MISIQALTAKMAFNNGKIVKNTGDSISKVQRKTNSKNAKKFAKISQKFEPHLQTTVQDYAILTLL
jgi:hypothetical protein